MEGFHIGHVVIEIFHHVVCVAERSPQIPGVQNLRRRIINLEIACGMEEMGRDNFQKRTAQIDRHPFVRNGFDG